MYYYSKNSSRKIIHSESCPYCKRMNPRNQKTFATRRDAIKAGYQYCRYCAPIAKIYRKERHAITAFAAQKGLTFRYYDGLIQIVTPYSTWKIITNGRNNTMFLYHKNTFNNVKEHTFIPGYHSQACHSDTIIGYMEYIIQHDWYRIYNPYYKKPAPKTNKKPPHKGTRQYRAFQA